MAETIRGIDDAGRTRPVGASGQGHSATGVPVGALLTDDVTLSKTLSTVVLLLKALVIAEARSAGLDFEHLLVDAAKLRIP